MSLILCLIKYYILDLYWGIQAKLYCQQDKKGNCPQGLRPPE